MGAGAGKYQQRTFLPVQKYNSVFYRLGFRTKELRELFIKFKKYDKTCSRALQKNEFVEFMGLDAAMAELSERAFDFFDKNEDGFVNFLEFVMGCWVCCTTTQKQMATLAFGIYDQGSKGFVTVGDFICMMHSFFGRNYHENACVVNAIHQFTMESPARHSPFGFGLTNFEEFCGRLHNHIVMSPIFHLQTCLQKQTLGITQWKVVVGRAESLPSERIPAGFDLLDLDSFAAKIEPLQPPKTCFKKRVNVNTRKKRTYILPNANLIDVLNIDNGELDTDFLPFYSSNSGEQKTPTGQNEHSTEEFGPLPNTRNGTKRYCWTDVANFQASTSEPNAQQNFCGSHPRSTFFDNEHLSERVSDVDSLS